MSVWTIYASMKYVYMDYVCLYGVYTKSVNMSVTFDMICMEELTSRQSRGTVCMYGVRAGFSTVQYIHIIAKSSVPMYSTTCL